MQVLLFKILDFQTLFDFWQQGILLYTYLYIIVSVNISEFCYDYSRNGLLMLRQFT